MKNATTLSAPTRDLSDSTFEMLRIAVNTAREYQCQSVSSLKNRLLEKWPDRKQDIEDAINYWRENLRKKEIENISNY